MTKTIPLAPTSSYRLGHAHDASSNFVAAWLCTLITLAFAASSSDFLHWFVIPVTLCGAIIGADAVDWFRKRMDLFDPVGLLGIFGFHFFFLSPLLIVEWNYQMLYLPPLDDWRPWLGRMAFLNLMGLVLYRVARGGIRIPQQRMPRSSMWLINTRLLTILLYFSLGISGALQAWVYAREGGISGYVETFEMRLTNQETTAFEGEGALFTFSESFPFLLMIAVAVYASRRDRLKSWWFVALVLLIFLTLRIVFGGLRGSRSNTLFAVIWAAGVVHFWIRPLSRRFFYIGALFALFFMYIMGFYKTEGSDVIQILENPGQLGEFEQKTNRTFRVTLLGDLSRDVQAYMLHNLTVQWPDFPYAWGRTYAAGYLAPVPRSLWPSKPVSKVKEGTEVLYGPGSYVAGRKEASRVYGLVGEAMLNFGYFWAPLSFVPLGVITGMVRRWLYIWHPEDGRRLLLPLAIIFCLVFLISDSDNNAVFLVTKGLVPFLVVWVSATAQKITPIQPHSDTA